MPLPSTHDSQITLPPYFFLTHPRLRRVSFEQAFLDTDLLKQLVALRRQEVESWSFLPSVHSIVLSQRSHTDTTHSYANSSGFAMTIRVTRRGSPSRDMVSRPILFPASLIYHHSHRSDRIAPLSPYPPCATFFPRTRPASSTNSSPNPSSTATHSR